MQRRQLLKGAAGGLALALLPVRLSAGDKLQLADVYGEQPIREGRVQLTVPALAENGNSVPLAVQVESPMTTLDHVTEIRVFAPRNPVPQLARFELSAGCGKAGIATRIRLSDTQRMIAVARMNDGSLWSGSAETIVTLAACIEPLL